MQKLFVRWRPTLCSPRRWTLRPCYWCETSSAATMSGRVAVLPRPARGRLAEGGRKRVGVGSGCLTLPLSRGCHAHGPSVVVAAELRNGDAYAAVAASNESLFIVLLTGGGLAVVGSIVGRRGTILAPAGAPMPAGSHGSCWGEDARAPSASDASRSSLPPSRNASSPLG